MPSSVRQISFAACFMLVLLRVALGWQFLYEGLWKRNAQNSAHPWSAEGYLANAQGPMRATFRGLVDDPDGLAKLDYDNVVAAWDAWRARFQALHTDLSDSQKDQLDKLLDGPQEFVEPLAELPPGVDLTKVKLPKGYWVRHDARRKRLATNVHLLPGERNALLKLAGEAAASADDGIKQLAARYVAAVKRLFEKTSKLSLKERLHVLLKDDPDRAGATNEAYQGTVDYQRLGEIQVYRHLLERYNRNLAAVRIEYQQDHLSKQWQEIQEKRAALVGPVDALTNELHTAAAKMLTLDQARRGPVPPAPSRIAETNKLTIWSLIVLGGLLMAGLFTRPAAVGAAGMLLMFYLAMPPWPGVPEPPGPEHSLIVNKNLIECVACLALAALPSGRWAGLDALVRRFVFRRPTD